MNSSGVLGTLVSGIRNALDVRSWFVSREISEEEAKLREQRNAIEILQDNLTVKRVGRTYVLTIAYRSPDPKRAARIANAYADAYFAEQLDARYNITRRASGWLQDRISELKDSSLRSDMAVQRFKAQKGIISTVNSITGGASYLSDQQLTEATTQMSLAHGDTARAEAKVQQIDDIRRSGNMDGAVTESLGNPVINDLRTKYLKASKTAAELSARIGQGHFQVVSLRNEMAQYERLIFDELQRIGQTYRSELEIARSKEKSLGESMASLIGNQAGSNEVMVQLRELERESDTFKNLYQTFLQRYQDAIQRETFPTSEARVISPAVPPEKPSSPKALLVFAASLLLGLMAGSSVGALRERRDRVFRIGSQVRDELGLELIGMLPTIEGQALPDATAPANPGHVQLASTTLRHALDAPLSGFAEILRSVKVEIDLALSAKKGARIVGVVSVLPGEGKTTISKNLASLLGFLGARTLLIDGDMRNPGLTRTVARHASVGLLEVLRGESSLADALLTEPDSNLDVLPIITKKRLWNSAELLSSPKMQSLLDQASKEYDYIVIDLPPIGPVVDVKAAAGLFDGFVFVVEWGKTARSVVRNSLMEDEQLYDKCVGVILNKVIGEQLRLYNDYGAKSYYYGKYGDYFVEDGMVSQ